MHIIGMILLISMLIVVHEAGHFFVARALKIRVDRVGFGLPIGPTLFEKKIGDITYCIHALLLGGYVGFPDDDPESTVPADDPDRISNRPNWQKALVISAGVIMNVVFAYFIVFFVAFGTGKLPSGQYDIVFQSVMEGDVPAQYAGFKKDDKIININGVKISNPMYFSELIQRSIKFDGYVEEDNINAQIKNIQNSNKKLNLKDNEIIKKGTKVIIPKACKEKMITIPEDFYLRKRPLPDGIALNDNQKKLRDAFDKNNNYIADGTTTLKDLATASADTSHPLVITVLREGKEVTLNSIYPNEKGLIGIYHTQIEVETPVNSFIDGLVRSNEYIIRNTYMMADGLVKLVIGKVAPDNMHGVVAIVKLGGDTIKRNKWDGLLLTALISIDLAIINLLPIPALDGGYLLFILLETILRRPLNEKITENISKICFLLLIILMILIIANDIWALVTKKF
ncbi:MAG: site-2 protease family protein [Candidatus Gastranaerophilales bacterium]|nr:site-2 protease family protein [Candidatus Gastranaerophilales bacterium]